MTTNPVVGFNNGGRKDASCVRMYVQ